MGRVFGYCRVSTTRQVVEGNSLEAQQAAINGRFRERHEPRGLEWGGFFIEHGVSGRVPFNSRKEGALLNRAAEKGDVIVFSKLDRGFRNLRDLLNTCGMWRERGVKIECLDLGLDTSTPVGRMVLSILAAVAEFERERLGERIRESHERRKALGIKAKGQCPIGMRSVNDGHGRKRLMPDTYARKIMCLIYDWHVRDGDAFVNISHRLNRNGLRNKANGGRAMYWSAMTVENWFDAEVARRAKEGTLNAAPQEQPPDPGDNGRLPPDQRWET